MHREETSNSFDFCFLGTRNDQDLEANPFHSNSMLVQTNSLCLSWSKLSQVSKIKKSSVLNVLYYVLSRDIIDDLKQRVSLMV